MLFIVSFV